MLMVATVLAMVNFSAVVMVVVIISIVGDIAMLTVVVIANRPHGSRHVRARARAHVHNVSD